MGDTGVRDAHGIRHNGMAAGVQARKKKLKAAKRAMGESLTQRMHAHLASNKGALTQSKVSASRVAAAFDPPKAEAKGKMSVSARMSEVFGELELALGNQTQLSTVLKRG